MADISIANLDAGTDSPAAARVQILEAVQRVNTFSTLAEVNLNWWSSLAVGSNWTAAMQAALATGKSVFVPWQMAARDITPGSLTFANDRQVVFGDGEGSWLRLTATGLMFNADGRTGCGLRDLRLSGPGVASAISSPYVECAFRAITATRCFVRDCFVDGWAGGAVFMQTATRCKVERNTFTDAKTMPLATDAFGSADIVFWGACVDCRIENNTSDSAAAYGVILQTVSGAAQASYRNKIRGNTIVGSKNYGVLVYNIDSAVHVIESTEISGNTIRDVYGFYNNPASGLKDYGAGIYVLQAEKTTVTGNVIENTCINTAGSTLTPAAIAINATSKATVSHNEIKTSAWYGVMVVDTLQQGAGTGAGSTAFAPTGFVHVTGNNIQSTQRHGIFIQNKHNVHATGNTIDGVLASGNSGIVVETTSANYPTMRRIKTDNNLVFNVFTTGIILGATTGASACGNTIDGASNTGIFAETTDGTICSNNIRNCTSRGIDLRSTGTNSTVTGNRITGSTTGILAGHRATFGENNDLTGCTAKWAGTYAPFQTAAPAAGTWTVGDRVLQLTPTVGQPKAWVCRLAGTPGTWVSEGNL
jgi:Right handed beta helix region